MFCMPLQYKSAVKEKNKIIHVINMQITLLIMYTINTYIHAHTHTQPEGDMVSVTYLEAVKMQVSLVVMLLIAFLWAETSPDVGRRERETESVGGH